MQLESQQTIVDSLNYGDVFAFQVHYLTANYDADRQVLTASSSLSEVWRKGLNIDPNWHSLVLLVSDLPGNSETEIRTNAFGAQKSVSRDWSTQYELAIRNSAAFKRSHHAGSSGSAPEQAFVLSLPLSRADAPTVKERVKLLAICKLVKPYTSEVHIHRSPTIDLPFDVLRHYYYVHAQLLQLWLYDSSSGRILARSTPNLVVSSAPAD